MEKQCKTHIIAADKVNAPRNTCLCGGNPCYAETYWKPNLSTEGCVRLDFSLDSVDVPKMYSREEVEKLIIKFSDYADSCIDHDGIMNACCSIGGVGWDEIKWIKDNL